ncbi:MAG: hypothetical protein M3R63_22495 [Actinomycetota bacterium]|nr:hypothetical protein [Actinomycetota bacterium]
MEPCGRCEALWWGSGRGRPASRCRARAVEAYGSAVRTTLRNNATAYGFSVSITAAFSL